MKKLILPLLALILFSCSYAPIKDQTSPPIENPSVEIPIIKIPAHKWNVKYSISSTKINYQEAIKLIEEHGNSDKFFAYVKSKTNHFSHVDGKSVDQVIKEVRDNFSLDKEVKITFYWNPFTSALGGWDGQAINENTSKNLNKVSLASHILHETTHVFGWYHQGNYESKYDNANSVPYVIGNHFYDYLQEVIK